jgi:hypothetical protein
MDFFARQDRARAQTGQLLGLFALSVTLVVAGITAVLVLLLSARSGDPGLPPMSREWWLANAQAITLCAAGVLAVVLAGTAFKVMALQGGGAVVARSMGADLVDTNTNDPLQKRLLRKGIALLKPGGTLVYCTCSLEPEEGEQAIAALLAAEPAVRRAPIAAGEVAGLTEILTAEGDLRTLPCHLPHPDPRLSGLDGFYAARLVKS